MPDGLRQTPTPSEPEPPQGRDRHPYFLWEMIQAQPAAIHATITAARSRVESLPQPVPGDSVLLTGIGTSFHAALGSAFLLAEAAPSGPQAFARPSSEIDPERIPRGRFRLALVFSESGETWSTLRAQETLAQQGVEQLLVSPTADSASGRRAEHHLGTVGARETSWTHTVSYTTALAAAATLFDHWGGGRFRPELASLAKSVSESLGLDLALEDLAKSLGPREPIWLLGDGAEQATVREAALKIREASGSVAIPVGIEEFLHGSLPAVHSRSAVLAVGTTPSQTARAREALAAAADLGSITALFDASGSEPSPPNTFIVPPAGGALGVVPHIVPFQLLAYRLALTKGRNPDVMGLDRPEQRAARRRYGL
ncbi:MAG TPA: SIS domain-containing protein [Thermoplasmata archaeon]|nr:SIS domain-containing protein [Thermoplasmata archaeon]